MLLILVAFLQSSFATAECSNLEIRGQSVTIEKNGQIKLGEHNLSTTIDNGVEKGFAINKVGNQPVATRTEYTIVRNGQKLPESITTDMKLWDTKKNEEFKSSMPAPPKTRAEFSHDEKNGCQLKRIITAETMVSFDRGLCEKLSAALKKFTAQEVEKCEAVLKEMAASIESFKNEIKSKNLQWVSPQSSMNVYEAALMDGTQCRRMLDPSSKFARTLEIQPAGAAETKQ